MDRPVRVAPCMIPRPSWTVMGWGSRRRVVVGAVAAGVVLAVGAGALTLAGVEGDRADGTSGQLQTAGSIVADPARTWLDPVLPEDIETTTTTTTAGSTVESTTTAAVSPTTTPRRGTAATTTAPATTTTAVAAPSTSAARPSRMETIGDFTVSCTPPAQTIVAGKSGSVSCTYTSVDGFSGTVQINCLGASLSCPFDRASVDLVAGGTASAIAVIAVPAGWSGSPEVTLSAYSHRLNHPTRVRVDISTFRLRCSPTSTNATPGGWTDFVSCDLTSLNGWGGTASLSCSDFPPGITCAFSSESVTVPSGGMALASLRLHAETDVPPDRYSGWVVGRSDTILQKTSLNVTVTSPSSSG